jgi:nucleoporin SEH1
VAWNITGTVLAGSGDYGVVTLWKADHKNEWKCVSEMKGK